MVAEPVNTGELSCVILGEEPEQPSGFHSAELGRVPHQDHLRSRRVGDEEDPGQVRARHHPCLIDDDHLPGS